jgi:hypothetical protein
MYNFSAVIGCIVIGSTLLASPVGNPSFPQLLDEGYFIPLNGWGNFRLGYEGDFVGDGCLKQYDEGHGRVDNFDQMTNSGTVTINILDRLDLYGVFGSTRVTSDWRYTAADLVVSRIELETSYRFLWGVGARAILFEWANTSLGLGGRYSASQMKPVWMTLNGTLKPTSGTHLYWREWQIDLDMSYKIDLFIPYVGVKYSNAHVHMGTFSVPISASGSGDLRMKNRKPVGIVVGSALTTGKYFMLNVEARLVDELAGTISGDFRF